jgi:hypothetical protein
MQFNCEENVEEKLSKDWKSRRKKSPDKEVNVVLRNLIKKRRLFEVSKKEVELTVT